MCSFNRQPDNKFGGPRRPRTPSILHPPKERSHHHPAISIHQKFIAIHQQLPPLDPGDTERQQEIIPRGFGYSNAQLRARGSSPVGEACGRTDGTTCQPRAPAKIKSVDAIRGRSTRRAFWSVALRAHPLKRTKRGRVHALPATERPERGEEGDRGEQNASKRKTRHVHPIPRAVCHLGVRRVARQRPPSRQELAVVRLVCRVVVRS